MYAMPWLIPIALFPKAIGTETAVLATDPLVETLRLPGVTEAYRAAQAERLQQPPHHWMDAPTWALPNNLPATFEHTITGLIGRENLLGEIRSLLGNPRFPLLAIVGPGGFGKTSVVLEVLHQVVRDRRSPQWIDRVVFVSSKVEILTPQGAKTIPAPETVDALHHAVDEETDGALSTSTQERVLLCLDNVDTILAEQADALSNLLRTAPYQLGRGGDQPRAGGWCTNPKGGPAWGQGRDEAPLRVSSRPRGLSRSATPGWWSAPWRRANPTRLRCACASMRMRRGETSRPR